MARYVWSPQYFSKKEILEMENHQLLNAFAQSSEDLVKSVNFRSHTPVKLLKQIEWMRDEILSRMR